MIEAMATSPFAVILMIALGIAIVGLIVGIAAPRPLTRERVEKFAERQRLLMTSVNGPLIVAALATTHRWRRFGLAAGLILALLWAMREGEFRIDFLAMFLGWFVGAIVAEWRINSPAQTGRRRADLRPRTPATFLTPYAMRCLWVVSAALVATGIAAGVGSIGTPVTRPDWLVTTFMTLVVAVALWAVSRRVVDRPRPSDPDFAVADAALRRNSFAIIAGSAVALSAWPITAYIMAITLQWGRPEVGALISFVGWFFLMVTGWAVGQQPSDRPAEAAA